MNSVVNGISAFSKLELDKTQNQSSVNVYDPFEPLPRPTLMDIMTHVLAMRSFLRNTQDSNSQYTLDVADWLSVMSNTLNGNIELIRKSGQINVKVMKAFLGDYDEKRLVFSTATRELIDNTLDFWPVAIDIARTHSITQCVEAMSGKEQKKIDKCLCSEIFFPCIYTALVLRSKANLLLSNEGRSNVKNIITEYTEATATTDQQYNGSDISMSVLSSQMPLKQTINNDVEKELAFIYYDDDEASIKRKVAKAYCLPKDIETNPVLSIFKMIIFPAFKLDILKKEGEKCMLIRDEKRNYEGEVETIEKIEFDFDSYEELEKHFATDEVSPQILKAKLIALLSQLIQPIKKLFAEDTKVREIASDLAAASKKKKGKK